LAEATMAPFDPMLDYAGCVIQYGYVVYFSVSWPLAPFVCALHTMFRLRSNVLRMSKLSLRPKPEATTGIGLWQTLLTFEAWSCVLINCLIVTLSTDQLDYLTCWTHDLFRDKGECVAGQVPMIARFLLALAAEHVVLGIIFIINAIVPERDTTFDIRLKKAAFQFKKRYMAEVLMSEASSANAAASASGLRLRSASGGNAGTQATTLFRAAGAVDYEADWQSGSDLSDAYDVDESLSSSMTPPRGTSSTRTRA